jgi:DNA-binding response OmpR family regulator
VSRRVILVEPDPAGRSIMDRVLTAEGYAVDAVASLAEARPLLAEGAPVELLVVDEMGGRGAVLEDVRALRRERPSIPVIVTGTLLSPRVMRELLRLRVTDALTKPFTPDELREAVRRALEQRAARHEEALELSAATAAARSALAGARLVEAGPALRRAHGTSPLDAEVMALLALAAELGGQDADADRAYRAALALRREEDTPAPDPYEGLARLAAYASTRPAAALRRERAGAAVWIVTDPATELPAPWPAGDAPTIVLLSLGLMSGGPGAVYYREGEGPRAFALMAGAARVESIARVLAGLGGGPLLATEPTRGRLDLARLAASRVPSPAEERA